MTTKQLTLSALFVAFIAVCAQVTIQTPIVPFTLQVFAISLVAFLLPQKLAIATVIAYLLMGFIGFPIFAGGHGGFQTLMSPTFGFLLGFIPLSFVFNKSQTLSDKKLQIPMILFGYCIFYALSLTILFLNLTYIMNIALTPYKLLTAYWLTFIPTDILSIGLAYFLSKQLQKHISTIMKDGNL